MGRATVSNDEESAFTQLLYDWEVGDTGSSIEHTSDNTQERSQRKKGASPVVILEEEEDQEEVGERAEQESTFMEVEITRSPDDDEVAAEEGDPLNSKSEKKKAGTKRKRSRSSLECEVCGQVLKTKTGHRLHMLSHQGSEGKAFRCGVCGKGTVPSSNMMLIDLSFPIPSLNSFQSSESAQDPHPDSHRGATVQVRSVRPVLFTRIDFIRAQEPS